MIQCIVLHVKECACNTLTDVKMLAHLMLCHMGMDMACMHADSQSSLSTAYQAAKPKLACILLLHDAAP